MSDFLFKYENDSLGGADVTSTLAMHACVLHNLLLLIAQTLKQHILHLYIYCITQNYGQSHINNGSCLVAGVKCTVNV